VPTESSAASPPTQGCPLTGTRYFESSVTALSWVPSQGIRPLPPEAGLFYGDTPPSDPLADLDGLRSADAVRAANELRAWIEVEDGQVVRHGQSGRAFPGATRLRLGFSEVRFPALGFPLLRPAPDVTRHCIRFVQIAGACIALPAPRRVRHRPFFQLTSAPVWTALALTIYSDGRIEHELVEASPFPCHYIYDGRGRRVAATEPANFKSWYRRSFGERTPWGAHDSPALIREAETALEQQLSQTMAQKQPEPRFRNLAPGATLVEQDERSDELFLLLDGTLIAEVNGRALAELRPGSILGERGLIEGHPEGTRRTATLRAKTRCRVAVASAHELRDAGTPTTIEQRYVSPDPIYVPGLPPD